MVVFRTIGVRPMCRVRLHLEPSSRPRRQPSIAVAEPSVVRRPGRVALYRVSARDTRGCVLRLRTFASCRRARSGPDRPAVAGTMARPTRRLRRPQRLQTAADAKPCEAAPSSGLALRLSGSIGLRSAFLSRKAAKLDIALVAQGKASFLCQDLVLPSGSAG
jgi:hypothetical protein